MTRTATLPLLLALASAVPLAVSAQTHPGADTGIAIDAASAATAGAFSGSDDQAFQQWSRAERQRIENERAAANALHDQDQRACWQRFAVNACLDRTRERRRTTLDGLRHDELALNAQERQRRTAARLDEIASKQKNSAGRNNGGIADAPASAASGAQ
jgi:hypothetical protein